MGVVAVREETCLATAAETKSLEVSLSKITKLKRKIKRIITTKTKKEPTKLLPLFSNLITDLGKKSL